MKILITGANGFIGKNLIAYLKYLGGYEILEYDLKSTIEELDQYTRKCDFVFHLAGVNRPKDTKEFMEGNFGFTSVLLDKLERANNKCPIMISSSIQAELSNPYGESKKAGEEIIIEYGKRTGAKVLIYRFPNVFGKWSRPNYNSVVATFSHNIANGIPIVVNDYNALLRLIYIDDLVKELANALVGKENRKDGLCYVLPIYETTVGKVADLLESFKLSRQSLQIPNMENEFSKKLYATYLSYLPSNEFAYDLKMNIDSRGSFTEFIKTKERGQVSVNISRPGIIKGNHWHNTKNEKFLVVSGEGIIRFRKPGEKEVIEYNVSGHKLVVIDIPPGYTHNIENIGSTDMVTIMWANEVYDPNNPDTIFEEV